MESADRVFPDCWGRRSIKKPKINVDIDITDPETGFSKGSIVGLLDCIYVPKRYGLRFVVRSIDPGDLLIHPTTVVLDVYTK